VSLEAKTYVDPVAREIMLHDPGIEPDVTFAVTGLVQSYQAYVTVSPESPVAPEVSVWPTVPEPESVAPVNAADEAVEADPTIDSARIVSRATDLAAALLRIEHVIGNTFPVFIQFSHSLPINSVNNLSIK
jgi:hypothetical protein